MERKALILGVDEGRTNLGSAIADELAGFIPVETVHVTDLSDVPTTEQMVQAEYNQLICSCGLTIMRPFTEYDDFDIYGVIEANLTIPMIAARRFAKALATQYDAHNDPPANLIMIGSYAHNHVLSNSAPYCAAKAGLHMLGKCLAWELTSKNIRVLVIHPHSILDTPMTEHVILQVAKQKGLSLGRAQEYWQKDLQLPSRITRAEIARVVTLLMDYDLTPHISGSAIELYGGER